MVITLINLPAKRFRFTTLGVLPPLGLAYLASVLEKEGHEVEIIDIPAENISIKDFQARVGLKKSDIYGISSTLFGFQDVIKFSALIRKVDPQSLIILGGLCTVLSPELILKNIPEIDIVVQGEGEVAMKRICSSLAAKTRWDGIGGVCFRHNGSYFYNQEIELINFDELPLPAYHLLNIKHYYLHPPFGLYSPVISMETSRGCIFKCEFCCLSKNYRARLVESVVEEMVYLKRTYGINEIYFVDHTFTISQEYIRMLCQRIIDKKLKLHWTCKTRVDCVSPETLKIMKAAGCYMISYGVESGSEKILKNLNKGITVADIETAFVLTRKYGIRSIAYLIVGSPGENKDTIKETLRMVRRIKPDYVLYNALAPDPASELYNRAINEKIVSKNFFGRSIFLEPKVQWPMYTTNEFSRSDIDFWVRKGTRDFYLDIFYIIRCLLRIRTLNEVKVVLKGAFSLIADMICLKRKQLVDY
ncbi:MAG: radical SAM protein [Candidatus Omnitrophica bacterium]|nr:radical SAM protein [Candidatus Omnitrophota bacterium]